MQILKKQNRKHIGATLLSLGVFAPFTSSVAMADEITTDIPLDDKEMTELEKRERLVDTLQKTTTQIKAQLTSLEGRDTGTLRVHKSVIKTQIHNLKNQLSTTEQKLEVAEVAVKEEKDRIAEEKRKAEEARIAEEKRKAEEKRIEETRVAIQTGKSVPGENVPEYSNLASNSYPWGQCTWGAKVLAPWAGDYWGNGGQWAASAAAAGFKIGKTPVAGALVSIQDGSYGHVAYVSAVREDGMIQIMEANFGGSAYAADSRGIGQYRGWIHPSSLGSHSYIYPPGT